MQNFDNFEVGDIVYHCVHGRGEVILRDREGAVRVFFDRGFCNVFTPDGKALNHHPESGRELFFSPPVIVGDLVRPFKATLLDKPVCIVAASNPGQQKSYYSGLVTEESATSITLAVKIERDKIVDIHELCKLEPDNQ